MKKIVVIGSCNTDMVVKSERLPLPGETILGGSFLMNQGGKGANQAVAAARLGGEVTFVCKTGNDLFGDRAEKAYSKEGINTSFLLRDGKSASGVALIMVDESGENSIVVAPGANSQLQPIDIEQAEAVIATADMVVLQLEIPVETVLCAARIAARHHVRVLLNPAPAPAKSLPDELYKNIDILVPNETEASVLSGIAVSDWDSAEKAAIRLSQKGVERVLVTLGCKGALCYENNHATRVDAVHVKAVDTTGAGDTFCGALCVALCEQHTLLESARFAALVASVSVTRMGAQSAIPYRREIDALLNKG